MMRFHTQTAGSTLTAQQPEVNVVRTTIQALAAVLGGTQDAQRDLREHGYVRSGGGSAYLAFRELFQHP